MQNKKLLRISSAINESSMSTFLLNEEAPGEETTTPSGTPPAPKVPGVSAGEAGLNNTKIDLDPRAENAIKSLKSQMDLFIMAMSDESVGGFQNTAKALRSKVLPDLNVARSMPENPAAINAMTEANEFISSFFNLLNGIVAYVENEEKRGVNIDRDKPFSDDSTRAGVQRAISISFKPGRDFNIGWSKILDMMLHDSARGAKFNLKKYIAAALVLHMNSRQASSDMKSLFDGIDVLQLLTKDIMETSYNQLAEFLQKYGPRLVSSFSKSGSQIGVRLPQSIVPRTLRNIVMRPKAKNEERPGEQQQGQQPDGEQGPGGQEPATEPPPATTRRYSKENISSILAGSKSFKESGIDAEDIIKVIDASLKTIDDEGSGDDSAYSALKNAFLMEREKKEIDYQTFRTLMIDSAKDMGLTAAYEWLQSADDKIFNRIFMSIKAKSQAYASMNVKKDEKKGQEIENEPKEKNEPNVTNESISLAAALLKDTFFYT